MHKLYDSMRMMEKFIEIEKIEGKKCCKWVEFRSFEKKIQEVNFR